MTLPEQYETNIAEINSELEQYFVDISVNCPYGLDHVATYHQALFSSLPVGAMGSFLSGGYRRNGNCIYSMRCKTCKSCIPIRLNPDEFHPNRNQRRVIKKNSDVSVGIASLDVSDENIDLLNRFLKKRFPTCKNSAVDYYSGFFISSISRCYEIRYRVADKLIGVAIIDSSTSWMNAVYFYFDPDEGWRSPGTYNILYLIDFCKRNTFDFMYLGYQINEIGAMNYKAKFTPHQLYIEGFWQQISKKK